MMIVMMLLMIVIMMMIMMMLLIVMTISIHPSLHPLHLFIYQSIYCTYRSLLEAVVTDSRAWLAQASSIRNYNHELSAKMNAGKLLSMDDLKAFMKVLILTMIMRMKIIMMMMMIIMMIDDDDDYLDHGSDRNAVNVCDSVIFTIMIVTSLLLISIISPTFLIISAVSVTLSISLGYPIFFYPLYQPISISFSRHYPILPTSLFYYIYLSL